MLQSTLLSRSLLIFAVLISLYFISIALCIRPANDDFGLLAVLRERGFAGSVAYNFRCFNFRHIPLLLSNLLYSPATINGAFRFWVPLFYILMLTIFIISLITIIRQAAMRMFRLPLSISAATAAALFFLATLYFTTFQRIENWSYMAILLYNLMPVIFSIAGLALIIRPEARLTPLRASGMTLCFFIAGSGAENFSSGLIVFLAGLLAWLYKTAKQSHYRKKITIAFLAVLISSLIVYFSPGTFNRPAIENNIVPGHSYENRLAIFSFFELLFQKSAIFPFLFFTGWLALGSLINKDNADMAGFKNLIRGVLILSLVFLAITLAISQLVFHGHIPARAWFSFTAAATAALVCLSLFAGMQYLSNVKATRIILPIVLLAFAAYSAIRIPRMLRYAKSYDERVQAMATFKQKDAILFLPRLADPGVIVSSEISADTSCYINKIMRSAYGLDFSIALKK